MRRWRTRRVRRWRTRCNNGFKARSSRFRMALIPTSVTIQEVADLARVSPKTVSRVINDEPRVRSDTRKRILEAIEQLNYRPNLNARGLASNRSFLIGLFCDRPGDYLSEFQAGAVARCRA